MKFMKQFKKANKFIKSDKFRNIVGKVGKIGGKFLASSGIPGASTLGKGLQYATKGIIKGSEKYKQLQDSEKYKQVANNPNVRAYIQNKIN
jgi:hypothetical protein